MRFCHESQSLVLTESNDRFALYTLSILRNMESSSRGGRFERDHAAATFYTADVSSGSVGVYMGRKRRTRMIPVSKST